MEIYNPTYNSETNKIVAYLLPEPKLSDYQFMPDFKYSLNMIENSRIEIEVDDELREFIHEYLRLKYRETNQTMFLSQFLKQTQDITPIMDRIEVKIDGCKTAKENKCSRSCQSLTGNCLKNPLYIAKLKQVDKVLESKMDKEKIIRENIQVHLNDYVSGKLKYIDAVFNIQEFFKEHSDQQTKHLTEQLENVLKRNNVLENLNNTLSESLKLKTEMALELDKILKENGSLTEQLAEKERLRLEDENDFIKALNQADEQRVFLETKLAEKEKELSKWISVDEPPMTSKDILLKLKNGDTKCGFYLPNQKEFRLYKPYGCNIVYPIQWKDI